MNVYPVHAKDRVNSLERSLSFENVSFLVTSHMQQCGMAMTGQLTLPERLLF